MSTFVLLNVLVFLSTDFSVGLGVDCSSWVESGYITAEDQADRNWAYWTTYCQVSAHSTLSSFLHLIHMSGRVLVALCREGVLHPIDVQKCPHSIRGR